MAVSAPCSHRGITATAPTAPRNVRRSIASSSTCRCRGVNAHDRRRGYLGAICTASQSRDPRSRLHDRTPVAGLARAGFIPARRAGLVRSDSALRHEKVQSVFSTPIEHGGTPLPAGNWRSWRRRPTSGATPDSPHVHGLTSKQHRLQKCARRLARRPTPAPLPRSRRIKPRRPLIGREESRQLEASPADEGFLRATPPSSTQIVFESVTANERAPVTPSLSGVAAA